MNMRPNRSPLVTRLHVALGLLINFAPLILSAGDARMEVLQFESHALKNNPLHDPSSRPFPVFLPAQATNGARLPVVYYLPGYGGAPGRLLPKPQQRNEAPQKKPENNHPP